MVTGSWIPNYAGREIELLKKWQLAGLDTGCLDSDLRCAPWSRAGALPSRCVSFHAATAALILLLFSSAASAQVELVSAVKNDLVAQGVNLAGPCGAFEITKRVAWALRAQGVGLLDKSAGNNCHGYAVDYVVFPDGSGRDILGDGGGDNVPEWDAEPNEPPGTFAGRWRAPIDPAEGPITGTPVPPPVPPVIVLPSESPRLAVIEQAVAEIRQQQLLNQIALTAKLEGLSLQLKQHDEQPAWAAKLFGNHYVQLVLATVGTYITTHQMTQ